MIPCQKAVIKIYLLPPVAWIIVKVTIYQKFKIWKITILFETLLNKFFTLTNKAVDLDVIFGTGLFSALGGASGGFL